MFTLFLCYFCRANVFALFMVLSRANMFTLFYVIFSSECVCAVYGTFTSEYVYAVLLFFSSECVYAVYRTFTSECICAVYGTFTSECVFAVFTLLWYLHERICLRCLCYFSRANVFTLFMVLSRANMFIKLFFLTRRCLRWVMCSFLLANMFSLFMAPYNMSNMSCKRIWLRWFMEFFLKLLCSRSYAFLLLVLFMLLARSGFTRSVFIFCLSCAWLNQIGVAALSVKIEALEKQVSADSGPGASVRAPGGGPARRALRWDSYCSGTRKSGRRV